MQTAQQQLCWWANCNPSHTGLSSPLAFGVNRVQHGFNPLFCECKHKDKVYFQDTQSEDRKSFKPPFLLPWVSSRISILLRRWTTQFLGLEGGLEEDELEPEVLEEVDDL